MKRHRKAQEEVVGFVLIIVLISIIALVFLGFSLRQKPEAETDKQVENLLSAMMDYTTDCALYMPQYETVEDLIKSCYNREKCSDGRDTCQELQRVMSGMLKASEGDLRLDKPVKAYELNISYSSKQGSGSFLSRKPEAAIVFLKDGICTSRSSGAQQFIPLDTGNIILILKFCY